MKAIFCLFIFLLLAMIVGIFNIVGKYPNLIILIYYAIIVIIIAVLVILSHLIKRKDE